MGEFRKLALLAEADGHLRQKLQQVLKLSKEKWDDARDHAMRAVVADNRMRIWYADKASMELGLLFTCRLGNVDLDRPVGERLYLHAPQPLCLPFAHIKRALQVTSLCGVGLLACLLRKATMSQKAQGMEGAKQSSKDQNCVLKTQVWACRPAAEEVAGWAADNNGGDADGTADACAARAGAPTAAGCGRQLVAAWAPGLGNLPR